jgi:hypothetical protein
MSGQEGLPHAKATRSPQEELLPVIRFGRLRHDSDFLDRSRGKHSRGGHRGEVIVITVVTPVFTVPAAVAVLAGDVAIADAHHGAMTAEHHKAEAEGEQRNQHSAHGIHPFP